MLFNQLSDVDGYLNNGWNEIGGYVARADDVKGFSSYDDMIEALRLDYLDGSGARAFPDGGEGYAVIRYTSEFTEEMDIPYGEIFGGSNVDGYPCTLNGFTGSDINIIPEWKFADRLKPKEGAELIEIINGKETIVGIFDGKKFVRP
ncbi:hypothetical protein IA938_04575 [Listeria welshimeri]|uniref:hypothetical protein n=1 Tax=Listeria welshimeri TaxID=1643 RepID=UPI001887C5D4|nr:hypothetical protein [Listeria welshimeri]MBF2565926.1 hypothetical protein [Listeria welshimeri]MBF2568375.1 hypothetical protein [Listeria welshimeri]